MSFANSHIRTAHNFRLTFIQLKNTSDISRQQLYFLSYLIENGHITDFTVRSIMTNGLSWGLANQYLKALKRIDYTSKQGRGWTITDKGRGYYGGFMEQFNKMHRGPFYWK